MYLLNLFQYYYLVLNILDKYLSVDCPSITYYLPNPIDKLSNITFNPPLYSFNIINSFLFFIIYIKSFLYMFT